MTRRGFLQSTGAAAAPALLARSGKRNIVFILSDDHRWNFMGCTGHPWLKTPAMDRMARSGVLFQNAFVTTSLCSPSRACILTGLYAHAHGVMDNVTPLPANLTTFPEILQKHGYRTGFIGKWHMGGEGDAARPGFDRWVSFRGQGQYENPLINFDGDRRKTKGYVSDILTDEALRFIGQNAERPFFLYLSHKNVHSPNVSAERHKALYQNEPIPYPNSMADTEENYRGRPDWVRRQRKATHGVDGMFNNVIAFDPFYRQYCRTIASLDESIGRVLNELEEKRLLNDTLVVYMSDNGFLMGDHGLIDKRCMYEPSIRVPMLAHCPDMFAASGRPEGMALNIDIAPTFLDVAGAPRPAGLHGRSLAPLLAGEKSWRTEFLYEYFWERNYPHTPTVTGLRTARYSYMHYHGIWDLDELYDVEKDPNQMNNLMGNVRVTTDDGQLFTRIKDPELKSLVGGLRDRLWKILADTGGRREPVWRA
ncbi:MAG: sulfatase [Bryobacterales bacterium]|nr:sulfatase [Bryobacterales bacterium]